MKKRSQSKTNFGNVKLNAEQARDSDTLLPAGRPGAFGLPVLLQNAWQREYETYHQRACQGVQTRIAHGEKPRKAFRRVSPYYDGRLFKCDPKRRLALAESTLRNHFRKWLRGGEVPSVFRLKYRPRRSVFTAPILIRFLNFFCETPQRSRREAWRKFALRGGNFGPGMRAGKPLKISHNQLQHNFPASYFRKIRAQQSVMEAAQASIAALRFQFISEIRARFPDKPPRHRAKRELFFEI